VLEGGEWVRGGGGAAAGTGFSVLDACNAVLNGGTRLIQHHLSVEKEKAGNRDESRHFISRTLSYLLVPLMCAAIVGVENSARYFAKKSE
jgi:hypothetical protein